MATTLKAIKEKIKANKNLSGDELGRLLIFDIVNMYKNIGKQTESLIQDDLIKTNIQNFNKKDIQDYNFYSSLYNGINENYTYITACINTALYNISEITLNLTTNLLSYKILISSNKNLTELKKLGKIKKLALNIKDNKENTINVDYTINKDNSINKQGALYLYLEKLSSNFDKIKEASASLLLYNVYLDCIANVYNLDLKPAQANLTPIKEACDTMQKLKAIFIEEIEANNNITKEDQEQTIKALNDNIILIDPFSYIPEEENKQAFIKLLSDNQHNDKAIKLVSSVYSGIAFLSGDPLKEV